jgi:hypothetical protein
MCEAHAAYTSWWRLLRHRRKICGYGYALTNLLHNLSWTILEPNFVERDITFLNIAVPEFFLRVGNQAPDNLITTLVRLHDSVPEEMRSQLTWHPNELHRRMTDECNARLKMAEESERQTKYADSDNVTP